MRACDKFTLRAFALFLTCALLLLPALPVRADAGPKPSMDFEFEYQIEPVSVVHAELIDCEDPQCTGGSPLEDQLSCWEEPTTCSYIPYHSGPHYKLVIEFEDRTRESNVFKNRSFWETYRVTVLESSLEVESSSRHFLSNLIIQGGLIALMSVASYFTYLPALALTLAVETLTAGAYICRLKFTWVLLLGTVAATLLSWPFLWVFIPWFGLPGPWTIVAGEALVVVIEAVVIYAWGKLISIQSLTFKHALGMSFLINTMSYLAGIIVLS